MAILAGIGAAGSAASTISAIGSLVGGVAAFSQSAYQSALAKANAQQAKLNAQSASEIAQSEAMDIGIENKGLLGELISGQAASGIALSSPTAIRSRAWLRRVAYEDQTRRVESGNRQYANYMTQANVFNAEASANKTAGAFSLLGGIINAGASFVGSSTQTKLSPGYLPVPSTRQRYTNRVAGMGRLY